jgi:hypothetical protein
MPRVKIHGGEGSWMDLEVPAGFSLELGSDRMSTHVTEEPIGPKTTECVSLNNVNDSVVINSREGTVVVSLGKGVLKISFVGPRPKYD